MARPTGRPVREEVLAAAADLIAIVGVGAFSYGDLAAQLDIKAPSIHHHFRSKEDLVAEVVRRYRASFAEQTGAIKVGKATRRLTQYADIFEQTSVNERFCLCGAVAAEWAAIGDEPRVEVRRFFDDQYSWILAEIESGIAGKEFANRDPLGSARTFLAMLEGSMLVARTRPSEHVVAENAKVFLRLLRP
jgi:TetR/AcrR family transcriptional regulator, transcriptional repressor for nem operon